MQTAAAIGDDRLQKQAQGYVIPDSFTHGSSEQRQRWFETGLKSASSRPATPSRRVRSFSVIRKPRQRGCPESVSQAFP